MRNSHLDQVVDRPGAAFSLVLYAASMQENKSGYGSVQAEVKRVKPGSHEKLPLQRRDPTMTGGERAETPQEKTDRRNENAKPKEAPIIQKDVT